MNCRQACGLMMKYFDGELNDIENAYLKQHVKVCKNCGEKYDELNEILNFLENGGDMEPPCDFEKNVIDKINFFESKRKRRTEGILAVFYALTGIILLMLSSMVIINLRDFSLLEAVQKTGESLNSFSSLLFALYNVFRLFYDMAAGIFEALAMVVFAVMRTYYYVFIPLLLMLLIMQRMFINILKHGGESGR